MHKAKLRSEGGSTVVTLPRAALATFNLSPGAEVEFVIGRRSIELRPLRPKYTLAELLAQCDFDQPMSPEEREWLDALDVGGEKIDE